ncbi:MAG: cytochrome c1 [Betaproteobacteria bacterium]
MNKFVCSMAVLLVAALLLTGAGSALASGGADLRMEPAPVNRLDAASLQRGARNFVNYCLNCHSAKYMRYQRLTDLGVDNSMIQDNLMFASSKIGDTMVPAMSPADAKAWLGVAPPDLSVVSHVRGSDWIYNYFLGFYRDDKSASGWNNLVFPNVAMPHVAWALSGASKLVETEFEDHEKALAGVIAVKGLALLEPGKDGKWVMLTVQADPNSPGTMSSLQYQSWVADLVNYLDYMAEPNKNKRISLGIMVLIYLGVLFTFAYALKRNYWKEVH